MIEVFLNEHSLEGQFKEYSDFGEALLTLSNAIIKIEELSFEKRLFHTATLYHGATVGSDNFSKALKSLRDKSLGTQFSRLIRENPGFTDWQSERLQENISYQYNDTSVSETSVAEHAERRFQDRQGFLLSFSNCSYSSQPSIGVLKDESDQVDLDLVITTENLNSWLEQHPACGRLYYDSSSTEPPGDHHTALAQRSRFSRTGRTNQGRQIYLDRVKNHYCYVDNLHFGSAAHIEVFSANGIHIGEARLDGSMIPGTRDATKEITI